MHKLEISYSSKKELNLIKSLLSSCGICEEQLVEESVKGRHALSFYGNISLATQKKLTVNKVKFKSLRLDSSWKTNWKKNLGAFKITNKFTVVPAGKSKNKRLDEKHILIDTDLVFGSGLHPTTRLMARLIESKCNKFRSFLDIGTGTGLLSIISLKCGAEEIYSIDISGESIKTAEKNFRLNGIKAYYLKKVDFNGFILKRKFDFIAANLLTADLLRFKSKFLSLMGAGAYLAVSGIYKTNAHDFKKKFTSRKIKCVRGITYGPWHSFLFQKQPGKIR